MAWTDSVTAYCERLGPGFFAEPLNALSVRRDFPLSVSVGVAHPDEHASTTPEDLLIRADSTMYTAKRLRKKLAEVPFGSRSVSAEQCR